MILKAQNLVVHIGNRKILHGISVTSLPGKIIGLIGPNGAGKTTLIRVLAGLSAPSSGQLELNGKPLLSIPSKVRARSLAYLPQGRVVNWPMSVHDLVAMGRLPFQHALEPLNAESRSAVRNALRTMSVEALAARPAIDLSGGEQARVLLARALAQTPRILLADEPTAGLDAAHKLRLLQHLSDVATTGMSIIIVLHDLSLAARFCDHVILLHEGQVYDAGAPERVVCPKALRDVYGINAHIGQVSGVPVITPLTVNEPPA